MCASKGPVLPEARPHGATSAQTLAVEKLKYAHPCTAAGSTVILKDALNKQHRGGQLAAGNPISARLGAGRLEI